MTDRKPWSITPTKRLNYKIMTVGYRHAMEVEILRFPFFFTVFRPQCSKTNMC